MTFERIKIDSLKSESLEDGIIELLGEYEMLRRNANRLLEVVKYYANNDDRGILAKRILMEFHDDNKNLNKSALEEFLEKLDYRKEF